MRALTLTQPWAGLVASGIKLVENRPRRMIKREDFGKPFAIHASREIDEAVYQRIAEIAPDILRIHPSGAIEIPCRRDWYRFTRETSAVIGVATIERVFETGPNGEHDAVDCERLGDQLRWSFGPIVYVLRDAIALPKPVPCRGRLGFWTLPDDVAAKIEEQLR